MMNYSYTPPRKPTIVPNSLSPSPGNDSGLHNLLDGSRIPFENSRTMDECRVEVLRKFRKEIVETVRFCDVSRVLIVCGLVSKEECFEICKLPLSKQMTQCFQKVHDIMDILVCQKATAYERDTTTTTSVGVIPRRIESQRRVEETDKQNGLVKDIWKNFTSALRSEHVQLAEKMEEELDKTAESRLLLKKGIKGGRSVSNIRSILRKEDIGFPKNFHHVQHYGVTSGSGSIKVKHKRDIGSSNDADGLFSSTINNDNNEPISGSNNGGGVTNLDEDDAILKDFFMRAGVVSRHLLNPVTKQIICKFIAENGGIDAIREDVRHQNNPQQRDQEDFTRPANSCNAFAITTNNSTSGSTQERKRLVSNNGSEPQMLTNDDNVGSSPSLPATVPFEPTPRPTSKSLYF